VVYWLLSVFDLDFVYLIVGGVYVVFFGFIFVEFGLFVGFFLFGDIVLFVVGLFLV